MNWKEKHVLVTGDASLIGSHLVDAVREVLRYTKRSPRIEFHPEMPTGPMNRVADNSLAKALFGWEPKVNSMDGSHRTTDWYFSTKDRSQVRAILDSLLTERTMMRVPQPFSVRSACK